MDYKRLYRLLLILTLLFKFTVVQSQVQNKPPDRMKMLAAFNGEWKGEMVRDVAKKKVKYKLSHTSEKIAGGWGIQINEVAIIPETKGKYIAARIFSYNSSGDSTFMYTVDNLGETWFYTGTWETPKKLVLKSKLDVKGKLLVREITYQFMNPKQYNYKSITKVEGAPDEVVEMTMQRE